MKKLLVLLLFLSLSVPVFAGAYVPWYEDTRPQKLRPATETVSTKPAPEVVKYVETKTVEKLVERPKPAPSKGFAAGIYGLYPTLSYAGTDYEIEGGYTSLLSDQSAIIRGAGNFWQSPDKWTTLKAGLSIFPGDGPLCGLFVGAEQYITPSISLIGDIYPVKFGNDKTTIAEGTIGARSYF